MAYGFNKPKMKPCLGGMNHKWEFLKNAQVTKTSITPFGSSVQASLRGVYKCKCGQRKIGAYNPNEAKADLRDHLPGVD